VQAHWNTFLAERLRPIHPPYRLSSWICERSVRGMAYFDSADDATS
jgi:hypothetical protein